MSIFSFGKMGELSFKSSISSSTLKSLNSDCGVVIISASNTQRGASRSHKSSRSI